MLIVGKALLLGCLWGGEKERKSVCWWKQKEKRVDHRRRRQATRSTMCDMTAPNGAHRFRSPDPAPSLSYTIMKLSHGYSRVQVDIDTKKPDKHISGVRTW